MSKRSRILLLIAAVLMLSTVCTGCGCRKKPSENDNVDVKADDPAWHGNGMQVLPSSKTDDGTEQNDSRKLEYSLMCRFEGKMDENSFEVTELDTDIETGEFVEGALLQLRIENDSVREDINIAEIGENLTIVCKYNDDSQLVAERIIILEG